MRINYTLIYMKRKKKTFPLTAGSVFNCQGTISTTLQDHLKYGVGERMLCSTSGSLLGQLYQMANQSPLHKIINVDLIHDKFNGILIFPKEYQVYRYMLLLFLLLLFYLGAVNSTQVLGHAQKVHMKLSFLVLCIPTSSTGIQSSASPYETCLLN